MTSPIAAGGMLKFRELCLVGVMSAPDRPGIGAAIFIFAYYFRDKLLDMLKKKKD